MNPQISAKVCFSGEIHRVSKLPNNIKSLNQVIIGLFRNILPTYWALQYFDSDGDKVMLISEDDYKSMLNDFKDSLKPLKIYVVSLDEQTVADSQVPELENSVEYLQVIRKDEDESPQGPEQKFIPQENIEIKENEKDLYTAEIEKNKLEIKLENIREQKDRIKKIIKKLYKKDIDEERRQKLESKLEKIKSTLNEEQIHKIQNKIIKYQAKKQKEVEKQNNEKGFFSDFLKANLKSIVSEVNEESYKAKSNYKDLLKELSYHYNLLPQEKKETVNQLLGGVPEKVSNKFNNNPIDALNSEKLEEKEVENEISAEKTVQVIPIVDESQVNIKTEVEEVISRYNIDVVKSITTIPTKITTKDVAIFRTIVVKNTGSTEWPKNCFLKNTTTEIECQDSKLINVAPGKELSIVLIMNSPGKAGKYTTLWRLAFIDDNNMTQYIGDSIHVEFEVFDIEDSVPRKCYSNEVKLKAEKMSLLFPEAKVEDLLEFINMNSDLQLEEVIENYLFN